MLRAIMPSTASGGQNGYQGKIVAELTHVNKAFGDRAIVRDFSATILRGDKVGLIGPNGAGKTTFVDAISGFVPSSGQIRLGDADLADLVPHRRARAGLGRSFQDIELYEELDRRGERQRRRRPR